MSRDTMKPLNNADFPDLVETCISINALALLLFGLMPQSLMSLCAYAISHRLQ